MILGVVAMMLQSGEIIDGAGSAAGVGATSGIGVTVTGAVGLATGTGASVAEGEDSAATHSGAGSATGTGAASGVGIATAAAVGSSAGAGVATAVGISTAEAVGAASGTGAAVAVGTIAAFVPTDLGSVLAWYDGDDFTGVGDGTAISTWTDSVGGNNGTQSGSPRPTVDSATGLNGMAVVSIGTGGGALGFNQPDFLSALSSGAAIFVVKCASDPAGATVGPIMWAGSNGNSNHYPFTDSNIYDHFGSFSHRNAGNPTGSLASWHIGYFHSASNDWKYFKDGVQEISNGTNTVGWTTTPKIGQNNFAQVCTFKAAEIIYLTAVPSQSDREKLEGYLAHRWFGAGGLNPLDSGHPYKNTPPT